MEEEKATSEKKLKSLIMDMECHLRYHQYLIRMKGDELNDLGTSIDILYKQMPSAKLKFLGVVRKEIENLPIMDEEKKDSFMKTLSEIRKLAKEEMAKEKIKNKFSKENGIRKDTAEDK